MKHVIITGGAGFIGSHLCDAFIKKNYAVTAIDNLITGRKKNLKNAFSSSSFQWIEKDICESFNPEKEIPFLTAHGLDGILHFACPASPVDFDRIPFEILAVDSIGTLKTIELALKYKARYILASTSEIYGDPLVHPQKESYWGNVNPNGPRACYDETKRFAEACVSTAVRLKRLNGGIVRIFNTYGPRMRIDDGRVVPEMARQILAKEPLTIHGSGKQTRSFCFITDLIEGILKLYESNLCNPINLGNPKEQSILDFIKILECFSNQPVTLKYMPARENDPQQRCPDITQAKNLLCWTPKVDIKEGLALFFESLNFEI